LLKTGALEKQLIVSHTAFEPATHLVELAVISRREERLGIVLREEGERRVDINVEMGANGAEFFALGCDNLAILCSPELVAR
jgi:hypothetical protein